MSQSCDHYRPDLRATLGNLLQTIHRAATIADRLPHVPGASDPIGWNRDLVAIAAHVRLFADQVDDMAPCDRPAVCYVPSSAIVAGRRARA